MNEKVQKPPVLIDADDAEWFDNHYPSHGSWTWFCRTALRKFRALHESESPAELMDIAMRELINSQPTDMT